MDGSRLGRLLRQHLNRFGRDLLGLLRRHAALGQYARKPAKAAPGTEYLGHAPRSERAEDLVEETRLLVRVGLAEETGHHLLEGRGLVRVEGVSKPLGERTPEARPWPPDRMRHGRRAGAVPLVTCFSRSSMRPMSPSVRLPRPLQADAPCGNATTITERPWIVSPRRRVKGVSRIVIAGSLAVE